MSRPSVRTLAFALLVSLLTLTGCSRPAPVVRVTLHWVAGHTSPAFDPDGPPDALRVALERLLSRGLVERDSTGALRYAAAETASVAPDGLTWTVRLRPDLRFTDGAPVTADDWRAAMVAGLAREDHATRAWLLGAVRGVDRVRAGKPLPELGIEAPDARTLVLHLAQPDPRLLEKLASPGVGVPWKRRDVSAWSDAIGIGPYRVASSDPVRGLVVVRADSLAPRRALADTLVVRFVVGAPRARTLMRHASADVVWPLAPTLLSQSLPAGYALERRDASPPRRLLMVLRADVPPTTKLEARHALVHGINREELLAALGARGEADETWLEGAGSFDFPRLDAGELRGWLERGHLGASFHVVLAYDADDAGAEVARALQGMWAELGLYAELRTLRGPTAKLAPLAPTAAQVQLLEAQAPLLGAAAELATLVMPLRGPAVGSFRSGWRTREFDPWLGPGVPESPLDPGAAQTRLAEERVALPLARLPWVWARREAAPVRVPFTPATGPEFAAR